MYHKIGRLALQWSRLIITRVFREDLLFLVLIFWLHLIFENVEGTGKHHIPFTKRHERYLRGSCFCRCLCNLMQFAFW